MQAMHALEAFLLALCAKSMHGRILVRAAAHGPVRLQYLLLNPSDAFEPLLDKARAVLLLGGTMAPVCIARLTRRCPSFSSCSSMISLLRARPYFHAATLCQPTIFSGQSSRQGRSKDDLSLRTKAGGDLTC